MGLTALSMEAGVLVVRSQDQRRRDRSRVLLRLHFPSELDGAAVVQFLRTLVTLGGTWSPLGGRPSLVFEVVATTDKVEHRLRVPADRVDFVVGQLKAAIPASGIEPLPERQPDLSIMAAGQWQLTGSDRGLRTDQLVGSAAAQLAALRPLASGQLLVQQWTIVAAKPATASLTNRAQSLTTGLLVPLKLFGRQPAGDARPKELRDKAAEPLFNAVLRIGAASSTSAVADSLVRRMAAVLRVVERPGVHFVRRWPPGPLVARQLTEAHTPLSYFGCHLNARELAGVIAWPIGSPNVPGLNLCDRPPLPPSDLIPGRGRLVAQGNFPGQERPLAQDREAVLRHTLVLGPTGTGKSHALANMVLDDMAESDDRAVIVIDAKADLVDTILDRVPAGRSADVAILDPSCHRPLGLNPLSQADRAPELVADQVFGVLRRLWGLQAAPRTSDLLHAGLLTLCHSPGAVLTDLAPLLLDGGFRRRLVAPHTGDLALAPFWSAYEAMSEAERAQVVAPLLTRLRQFLMRPSLRAVLGQAKPGLSLSDIMNQGKVLLVPLAAGRLGQEAAGLIGALLVAELWTTTQARAGMPASARRPVSVFIDEWQTVVHLPTPLEAVLAQSRGYGVGYTLANQHLGQVPASLRDEALTNTRSKVCFALPPTDAAVMAKLMGPPVTGADLEHLGRYEVMVRLAAGATLAPPTTGLTQPLPPVTGHGDTIRQRSSVRYGRNRQEVENELRQRQTADGPGPLGKRRRT